MYVPLDYEMALYIDIYHIQTTMSELRLLNIANISNANRFFANVVLNWQKHCLDTNVSSRECRNTE